MSDKLKTSTFACEINDSCRNYLNRFNSLKEAYLGREKAVKVTAGAEETKSIDLVRMDSGDDLDRYITSFDMMPSAKIIAKERIYKRVLIGALIETVFEETKSEVKVPFSVKIGAGGKFRPLF